MKKFKKMIAVLMSVAMIVCMFTVSASAASVFDNAINLKALTEQLQRPMKQPLCSTRTSRSLTMQS